MKLKNFNITSSVTSIFYIFCITPIINYIVSNIKNENNIITIINGQYKLSIGSLKNLIFKYNINYIIYTKSIIIYIK